jgi:diacylglycerol kinase family enzyme
MSLPVLFNARAGSAGKDPDALLRPLPKDLRERVQPIPFGPPWDFGPHIAAASRAGGPLFLWGGDGSVHHAARALVDSGCPVALAVIPGGSGNGLARGLRTPLEPSGALQRLLTGRELRMDLPRLDGAPFLNVCGTGYEAAVAHRFADLPGRGVSAYARACWQLWRTWPEVELIWDAEAVAMPREPGRIERIKEAFQHTPAGLPASAWSLCFANLPQYGSGLWIAPGADPTDGALQWATLARPGWFDLLTGATPPCGRRAGCAVPACAWNAPCPGTWMANPLPSATVPSSPWNRGPSGCRSRMVAPGPRRCLAQKRPRSGPLLS